MHPASKATRSSWLQALSFIALFTLLQTVWLQMHDSAVRYAAVDQATVKPATWWVNLLTPEVQALAVGSSIRAAGGGINILDGCEGAEMLFLLIAAMLVAPLHWRAKLRGILLGSALVWLLNQIRVVGLFYAYRADTELFALLHGTLTPLAMVVALALFFLFYMSCSDGRSNSAA